MVGWKTVRGSLFLAVLGLGILGCGGKSEGTVKGEVVYKNQPINGGTINFQSKKGQAASAKIEDGKFSVTDPLEVGEYAVFLLPPAPEPTAPGAPKPKPIVSNIPPKARDMLTSGLTATIKPGVNELKLEVRD